MKKIKDIVLAWHASAMESREIKQISIPVNLHDVARLQALTELYPNLSEQIIISDLLTAALDEVEACLPYVQGQKVIATDDHGDPIYEDAGLTPKLLDLTRKHMANLKQH
ncbi:MAG: type 1 pili tip component [Gammaproteobacteria bacterium]